MNPLIAVLIVLLLAVPAHADSSLWRRIPELETFTVTTCLADPDLTWMTRSSEEQRALFTPEFYRKCSSGTSVRPVWPCCKESQSYNVLYSRDETERFLDSQIKASVDPFTPAGEPGWKNEYLNDIVHLVDFEKEALVLISQVYGATGMARADLHFKEQDGTGTLSARIEIKVPPPPLTPDTALFRFAFAVDKSKIDRVQIMTGTPEIEDLRVAKSGSKITFSI